jgi:glutamate/tyrosine decarboxylase-like PLP-dependent enzyme
MKELLMEAADRAIRYHQGLDARSVAPAKERVEALAQLGGKLPDKSADPQTVLRLLDEFGSPATVTSTGGRYFGFVTGGALPVTVAANWLAGIWDQGAAMTVSSPTGVMLERIAIGWAGEVLGLPSEAYGAFVTGTSMGNFTGLAAARHAVLSKMGWDVEARGLFGAPEVTVIVGAEVHITLIRALGLLGLGRDRVVTVPVDGQGRMRPDALPPLNGPTIVCLQAGNVNTGAFDPAGEICAIAHEAGAWVHVDGAFGLWAAASPERSHLTSGVADADSWATDAHKWLNVPYDCGLVFVRNYEPLIAAMSLTAAYLPDQTEVEPLGSTPEGSRRARGIETWAALRFLGRAGLANLVERCCQYATSMAKGLSAAGYRVLNDVVLNQVLVSFGDDETTRRVIAAVQADGTCWCGGTVWQGNAAMRISISSWATTPEDIERSLVAILRIADEHGGRST